MWAGGAGAAGVNVGAESIAFLGGGGGGGGAGGSVIDGTTASTWLEGNPGGGISADWRGMIA